MPADLHLPLRSQPLALSRFTDHEAKYPQLKDPSIVALPNGNYAMYATLCGGPAPLAVGRFVAAHPAGPWRELSPVRFHGLSGPELCAPAVRLGRDARGHVWEMFIQTSCFQRDGIIAWAISRDGCNFYGRSAPAASRASLGRSQPGVVGLYDAGVSSITVGGRAADCLVYSGYSAVGLNDVGRFMGVGDLYMSLRFEGGGWTPGRRILSHQDVPFHNQRGYASYEWGLEGAKLLQLARNQYLLVGVCFLEQPDTFAGQRQRVFLAAAASPFSPFTPVGETLEPSSGGETGHPDALIVGDKLTLIHQERRGSAHPWHLRWRDYDLGELRTLVSDALGEAGGASMPVAPPLPADPAFLDAQAL